MEKKESSSGNKINLINEGKKDQYSNRISLLKFILLSLLTFGIYERIWAYRTWKYFKKKDNDEINPVNPIWRTILVPFFIWSLYHRINELSFFKNEKSLINSFINTLSVLVTGFLYLGLQRIGLGWIISLFFVIGMNEHYIETEDKKLSIKPTTNWEIGLGIIGFLIWQVLLWEVLPLLI